MSLEIDKSQIMEKLDDLITRKIALRNKEAMNLPDKLSFVTFMDNELDLLEEIQFFLVSYESNIHRVYRRKEMENYERGFKSGMTSMRAGRRIDLEEK